MIGRNAGIDGRICFRCHSDTTYVSKKTDVATWRNRKVNGIWDGKNYYCDSCHHKLKRKCRNKDVEKDSRFGKGFRIEQVIAKTLGIKNCNIELDNFNLVFDLYDPIKYKDIQSRSAGPSIRKATWKDKEYFYDVWHLPIDLPEYDTFFAVCMSKGYDNIERMYAIPSEKLPISVGLTIYKDPNNKPWYEEFIIDEKPYNDIYHSMKIDDCPVIKNDNNNDNDEDKLLEHTL